MTQMPGEIPGGPPPFSTTPGMPGYVGPPPGWDTPGMPNYFGPPMDVPQAPDLSGPTSLPAFLAAAGIVDENPPEMPNPDDPFVIWQDPFEEERKEEARLRRDSMNTAMVVENLKGVEYVQGKVAEWDQMSLAQQKEMLQIPAVSFVDLPKSLPLPGNLEKAFFASLLFYGITQFNLDPAGVSAEQSEQVVAEIRELKGDSGYDPSEAEFKFYMNEKLMRELAPDLQARKVIVKTIALVAKLAGIEGEIVNDVLNLGFQYGDYTERVAAEVRHIQNDPDDKYRQIHEKVQAMKVPIVDWKEALKKAGRIGLPPDWEPPVPGNI